MEKFLETLGKVIVAVILGLVTLIETILKLIALVTIIPLVIVTYLLYPVFKNRNSPDFVCIWYTYAVNWQYWPIYFKFKEWYGDK